jgi:hypothetical protein
MSAVSIPPRLPGLKLATILLAIYFVLWIPLEGNLPQAVLMAVWVALVSAAHLIQRRLGGRTLGRGRWFFLAAVSGLYLGLASAIVTLLVMAVKTGLHAHGPEFTHTQINWVLAQLPYWTAAGLLAGLGLGLLTTYKSP